MIYIDAEQLQDGLYNIKDGKIYKYKAKGGTVRAYKLKNRPQGEWIKHDEERDYCSRCKHIFKTRTITKQDKWTNYIDDLGYNFCPNCGCRMKGADDETN